MTERYFPQGVAVDSAFCNRNSERAAIKRSIESHEHIAMKFVADTYCSRSILTMRNTQTR